MAAHEQPASDTARGWRARLRFWTIFSATLLVFGVFTWQQFRPRIHPQFDAAPYVAPAGCEVRSYRLYEDIAIACAEERYRFDQWRDYRLPSPGRMGENVGKWTSAYYRIGNDLVGISCTRGYGCRVNALEANVYRAKKRDGR
jgi:hypothetical protein